MCDDDIDGDGVPNDGDNCVVVPNRDQADLDNDSSPDRSSADTDPRYPSRCPAVSPSWG